MFSVVGFFIVLIIKAKAYADEDFYYNNGWRPISREKVLGNLHRHFINTPYLATQTDTKYPLYSNPILRVEENIGNIEKSESVNPININTGLLSIKYNEDTGADETTSHLSRTDKKPNYNPEHFSKSETKIIDEYAAGHRRQAKNIIKNVGNVPMNILHSHKTINDIAESHMQQRIKTEEANITSVKSNIYEVTEATEASEINDLLDINLDEIEKKETYFEPHIKTTTEKNLSNILLNILGNYNIKINDDLINYAVSRNKHNSNKQSYVYPTPIRPPPMWNSHNHFPLDPFLAVFLSNYGYYLPGFYGFPGKYYNIYGYLASNNIHNNKPFGAYKIYSDNDSSY